MTNNNDRHQGSNLNSNPSRNTTDQGMKQGDRTQQASSGKPSGNQSSLSGKERSDQSSQSNLSGRGSRSDQDRNH